MSAATDLAKAKGLTCTDERHREISSIWCVDDSAQIRMYIGGDSEGRLTHLSFTTVGNTDGELLDDLWRAGGPLTMSGDDFDDSRIAREFKGSGEDAELQMGGRLVRVSPWTSVIITTPVGPPGWSNPRSTRSANRTTRLCSASGLTAQPETTPSTAWALGPTVVGSRQVGRTRAWRGHGAVPMSLGLPPTRTSNCRAWPGP
ncbi:hypothetical protein G7085_11180 [Tessaracoccus sp. HDW20]|uniref:hypothetical protein n=1 Tax=Tessaracoccus coleopterorum TaxID=2714950 RepID=UPI0018D4B7DA|nr:hypothetical protein [Tessaracoccus coleopterorum]NHB84986.1 hypothetical protein [Tessaracoccus coleopterorum]